MTEPSDLDDVGAALELHDVAVAFHECRPAHVDAHGADGRDLAGGRGAESVRDDLASLQVGQIGRREFQVAGQERAKFGLQAGHGERPPLPQW